jgi:hypothetical protein
MHVCVWGGGYWRDGVGFRFDGEEDAVDEIVGGWKMMASSVGAVQRRDPKG